jgi:hypothetical protein
MDKSGAVAADDDSGSCGEAPRVMYGSRRGRDGGGTTDGKIPASPTRIGPTTAGAFPVAALEVPASDEAAIAIALFARARELTGV